MTYIKRIVSILIASILILTLVPMSVSADEVQLIQSTPKEEVIYVNLNGDGSVKEIYVVNIFELDEDGKIIDYGKYETLRNMTTTDKLGYSASIVTIDAKAGKLYYEGKLESNIIPWNISVKYYMDGTEYSATEIAGKSGDFKLKLTVSDNENCEGDFFEGYALQTSFTLDTKKCKDIVAEGATLANVGSDKQITYTILPGKGAHVEVTAKVTDFEMSAISLNGVKLRLNIDINDDSIQDLVDKITSAISDIDSGAGKLNDGAGQLYEGTSTLEDKVGELYNGVGSLTTGSGTLSNGLAEITSKNKELLNGAMAVFEGLCNAANNTLNAELAANGFDTIKLTPKNYATELNKLLKLMDADNVYQKAYDTALKKVTKEVEANADALYKGYIEANADSVYRTYIESISQSLYEQVAGQVFYEELIDKGFSESDAAEYLELAKEKGIVSDLVKKMTADQKEQIITGALASLTDDQKKQIREGALESLTSSQKKQIREGYIDQLMKSEEVTKQITDAVSSVVGTAVASITSLKGQLDNYSLFYDGLVEYTSAVSEAAKGANTIKINMNTLYSNVGLLNTSVGDLNDAVKTLFDGTTELKNGTAEFVEQTSGIDTLVSDMIDSVISSVSSSGEPGAVKSFVSEQNTSVKSVQFVIKTPAINAPAPAPTAPVEKEKLNFWQKLLRLFGLY
ncbi:MAG: hypothetical protein E7633_08940 [Ruminococcaceae bacterium]|nr:hypothetical protein [Oscillospiraceae bacterium]